MQKFKFALLAALIAVTPAQAGAPWLLDGGSVVANSVGALVGLALVALSLPRGATSRHHYGSWDRLIV